MGMVVKRLIDERSIDDFKDSVARQTSIPAQQLVALTPGGKTLKFQMLHQEVRVP